MNSYSVWSTSTLNRVGSELDLWQPSYGFEKVGSVEEGAVGLGVGFICFCSFCYSWMLVQPSVNIAEKDSFTKAVIRMNVFNNFGEHYSCSKKHINKVFVHGCFLSFTCGSEL